MFKKIKKKNFSSVSIPRFDKSIDDRLPKKKWQNIMTKPDIVIFEGWCVGVTPQKNKDLKIPINELEKEEDTECIWRKRVNKELKINYKKIFAMIDQLIFLKVPNFNHVLKWRILQERKLNITSKGKKIMDDNQIRSFIMFYERLTKHMLKNFGNKANIIINIDKKHRLKTIKFN